MRLLTTKYDPDVKHHVKWKAFSCLYNSYKNSADTIDVGKNTEEQTAGVISCFARHEKEEQEGIYPPTISEIADAQQAGKNLHRYFKCGGASNDN